MKLFAVKVAIAVVAIGTVFVVAASQLAPGMAAWKVLLWAAGFALVLVLAALLHAYLVGSLKQQLLRWGAIDTQWLWAPDYPKGFKRYFRNGRDKGDE
jgi:hypothetical protein